MAYLSKSAFSNYVDHLEIVEAKFNTRNSLPSIKSLSIWLIFPGNNLINHRVFSASRSCHAVPVWICSWTMFHHFIVVIHNWSLLIWSRSLRGAWAAWSGCFIFLHDIFFVNAGKMQRDSADTLDNIAFSCGIIAKLLKLNTIYW